MIQIPNSKT